MSRVRFSVSTRHSFRLVLPQALVMLLSSGALAQSIRETPPAAASAATEASGQGTAIATNSRPSSEPTDAPKSAERTQTWVRDGFYLRSLTGQGYAFLRGNGPTGKASIQGLGTASYLAIGGSVTRDVVLAMVLGANVFTGEFKGGPYPNATFTSNDKQLRVTRNADTTASIIGGLIDWYPNRNHGIHVGLGAGVGIVRVIHRADDSDLLGANFSGIALAGYDSPIARMWALGLALTLHASTSGSLQWVESGKTSGYKLSSFGIGLTGSVLYF